MEYSEKAFQGVETTAAHYSIMEMRILRNAPNLATCRLCRKEETKCPNCSLPQLDCHCNDAADHKNGIIIHYRRV